MTIAEMNKADMQVIKLVNDACDRRQEEELRRQTLEYQVEQIRSAVNEGKAEVTREVYRKFPPARARRMLIAFASVLCFLASMASVAAMELGRLTPTVGIVGMVVPAVVALRMMIRDAGR